MKNGLSGVLRPDAVQPLDRLVGHLVREVVGSSCRTLRHADDRVVLGQARVVLAGLAAEEPVEVVEPPAVRPAVKRPGRALLADRASGAICRTPR